MTTSTTLLPPVRPIARPVEAPPWWRRPRRRPRPDLRRLVRRVLVRSVVAALLLALAMVGWLGVRAAMAVSALVGARPALQDVTGALAGGDRDTVLRSADEVRAAVGRAHDLVDEPVWRTAEHLPWIGTRLHAVRATAQAADILATDALGPVVTLADTLWFGPYDEGDGFTELLQATELRGDVETVADAVVRADAAVAGVTTDLVVPELSAAFAQGLAALEQAADVAVGLGPGLDVMLDISGYPEETTTAVVVLDDSAARPLGGEIERVYLLPVERGTVQRMTVLDVPAVRAAAAAGPTFTAAAAGPQAALLTTPDVTRLGAAADAGAALADGVAAVAGVTPRTVVLVTPEGLDLVHAPAAGDAGASLAQTVADAPPEQRGALLDEGVRTVVHDVLALRAAADATALAVGDAVVSGELRVWSADRGLQEDLAPMRGGGGLPGGPDLTVTVTADDAGAPSGLAPQHVTTATGQCGALWTRRSEAVLTVAMADVPDAPEGAAPPRLLVGLPRGATVLGVEGPDGALPHEVLDLPGQQLLAVTPAGAGEVSVRLAGGTRSLEGVDVVTRGGLPAAEEGSFTCG
ncbi:hypothetical protein AA0Y32_00970 [Georgenia phoenicis]|uniref:hypothetical protein n=1 Tax=unclassified Georgenia TaxID=2626815 RepID=UPI0039B089F5